MLRPAAPPRARGAALASRPGRGSTTTAPPAPAAAGKGFSPPPPSTTKPDPSPKRQQQKPAKKAGPPTASSRSAKPRSNGRGALRRLGGGPPGGGRAAAAGPAAARATPVPPGRAGEWVRLASLSEWRPGKAGKAVTLPDGSALCLFALEGGAAVYATDVYSTAFKYPMVDAAVGVGADGVPTATVPFDGTAYNLLDGAVVEWCPANTPVRALLGAMKSRAPPTPLAVYPARVAADGEGVEVWFAR